MNIMKGGFVRRTFIAGVALLLVTVAMLALGIVIQDNAGYAVTAFAEGAPANIKVNALGVMRWDPVDAAEGYEWTYSVGGVDAGEWYGTDEGQADVAQALQEAVEHAQKQQPVPDSASVTFQIRAGSNGEAQSYTHTFNHYINYGFGQHDISDVYGPMRNGDVISLSNPNVGAFTAHSVLGMNELMTFGVKFTDTEESTEASLNRIYFMGQGKQSDATKYNYFLQISRNGMVKLGAFNDLKWDVKAKPAAEDAFAVGTPNYFSLGFFDAYDIDGTKNGEVIYAKRTDSTGKEYFEYSTHTNATTLNTYSNNVRQGDWSQSTLSSEAGEVFIPKASMRFEMARASVQMFSGIPMAADKVPAPSYVYYDNETGNVCWNRADGAVKYQWAYGNGTWNDAAQESFSAMKYIGSCLQTKTPFVRFRVRTVGKNGISETRLFGLDLTTFYKSRTRVTDIASLKSGTLKNPSDKDNLSGEWVAGNVAPANTHIAMAFQFENKPAANLRRLYIPMQGSTWAPNYNVSIYQEGVIGMTRVSTHHPFNTENTLYWQVPKIVNEFEIGKKYHIVLGYDELFDFSGYKICDRISAKISQEEDDGYRRVLTLLTHDYYEYKEDDKKEKINYNGRFGFYADGAQGPGGSPLSLISVSPSRFERAYTIIPAINNKRYEEFTETVTWGEKYDFRDNLQRIETLAKNDGYLVTGWNYTLDGDNLLPFNETGYWNTDFNKSGEYVGLIHAETQLIDYTVTYEFPKNGDGVSNANPTTYTVEDAPALLDPTGLPAQYVFSGWYLKYENDSFSEKIIDLNGMTGNLTIYGKIERGYTVTLTKEGDDSVILWIEGSEPLILDAGSKPHKTFIGWYADSSYSKPYTGGTTLTPSQDMHLYARFDWTQYEITYVADGGIHNNAAHYTWNAPLTEFQPALKEGCFFAGWYTDQAYTEKIADTVDKGEALTLYAKYIKDDFPSALTYYADSAAKILPLPNIPEGSTYTVQLLSSDGDELKFEGSYIFASEGSYTLRYEIKLPYKADPVIKEAVITVGAKPVITLDGDYEASYTQGSTLTLISASGDGADIEIEVLKDGQPVEIEDNKIMLEAGEYTITYRDKNGVADAVSVTFTIDEKDPQNSPSGLPWYAVFGIIAGCVIIAGGGVVLGICLIKRKNRSKK